MINVAKLKLYGAVAAAAVAGVIALAVWWNARDERLRREGEHRAEVRAVALRADSALQLEKDSAAVRQRRDSIQMAVLHASLDSAKAAAAEHATEAIAANTFATETEKQLAAAATKADSLPLAIKALAERTAEAMAWRATADRHSTAREIAERALAAAERRVGELQRQHTADLQLIADLNAKLKDPLSVPTKQGFFTTVFHVARDAAAIVGVAAAAVAVAVIAK